jgi:hypothetical protein
MYAPPFDEKVIEVMKAVASENGLDFEKDFKGLPNASTAKWNDFCYSSGPNNGTLCDTKTVSKCFKPPFACECTLCRFIQNSQVIYRI